MPDVIVPCHAQGDFSRITDIAHDLRVQFVQHHAYGFAGPGGLAGLDVAPSGQPADARV